MTLKFNLGGSKSQISSNQDINCCDYILSKEHDLAVLIIKDLPECGISNTRDSFCLTNDAPVLDNNLVMMTISSTIYRMLLECVKSFQDFLTAIDAIATTSEYTDGDDVYYRFGGAAICDMLKLHYDQIRS